MMYLGIADILSAGFLGLKILGISLPVFIFIISAGYLLIKNLFFGLNWASAIDLSAAGLMILSIFSPIPGDYYPLISGILAIKGFQSVFISLI